MEVRFRAFDIRICAHWATELLFELQLGDGNLTHGLVE